MAAKKKSRIGRPPLPEGPAKTLGFRFHDKLIKRFDKLCRRLKKSRSVLVRELVEEKLEEEGL